VNGVVLLLAARSWCCCIGRWWWWWCGERRGSMFSRPRRAAANRIKGGGRFGEIETRVGVVFVDWDWLLVVRVASPCQRGGSLLKCLSRPSPPSLPLFSPPLDQTPNFSTFPKRTDKESLAPTLSIATSWRSRRPRPSALVSLRRADAGAGAIVSPPSLAPPPCTGLPIPSAPRPCSPPVPSRPIPQNLPYPLPQPARRACR
jgi:hypothetical protein